MPVEARGPSAATDATVGASSDRIRGGLSTERWIQGQLKSGETGERLTYAERDEAEEALAEWIGRARGPEQIIGRAVQALVAAFHADQGALPRAERRPAAVPGAWGGGLAAPLPDIIAALARPVLPERLAARLREADQTAATPAPDWPIADAA